MKTKLEMAHEWYMKYSESPSFMNTEVEMAWQYADAMQAEADKREDKKQAERIKIYADAFMNCGIQVIDEDGACRITTRQKELDRDKWQPDWSQAPSGALSYHIELDELDGSIQPFWTDSLETHFDGEMFVGYNCAWNAPSFNYQGDWRNSLRKRPQ